MKGVPESDFLRLFVRHETSLRSYARVLMPSWEAVDELMQEASVVMWRKLGQLEDADGFLPWAKVILRFEGLRIRRDFSRDRHDFSEDVLTLLAEETAEVSEDIWEMEREALERCLTSFAPHHRELLLAPYRGEGRVSKIADTTARSVNSLYKLLGRLREKLLTCVETRLQESTAL